MLVPSERPARGLDLGGQAARRASPGQLSSQTRTALRHPTRQGRLTTSPVVRNGGDHWSLLGIEPHGRTPTPQRRWLACIPEILSNSVGLSWSRLRERCKRRLNSREATRLPPSCSPTWRKHFRCSGPSGTSSLPTPQPASPDAAGASREAPHGRSSTDSLASKKYTSWERCTTSPRRSPAVRAPAERDDRRSRPLSRGASPHELTIRAAVTTTRVPRAANLQSSTSRDRLLNPSARVRQPISVSAPPP